MKTLIIIPAFLFFFCSCSEKTINIGSSIDSKTLIKSKKVCLDNASIAVSNGHELTIQCKKLIVNQNTEFTGDGINVTIEYRKLKGKDIFIKAASDKSTLVVKKKKIQF